MCNTNTIENYIDILYVKYIYDKQFIFFLIEYTMYNTQCYIYTMYNV